MAKILIIDDERAIRNTLKEILETEDYEVDVAETGDAGLAKVGKTSYDLVFTDIKMPGMDGIEFLEKSQLHCPVIMISGHGNIETAVEAMKKGAWDFMEKPLDLNRLLQMTKNAIAYGSVRTELKEKTEELQQIRKQVGARYQMVGDSAAITRVREIINKVAGTEARVLITGENGTGKEVVAHLLHVPYGLIVEDAETPYIDLVVAHYLIADDLRAEDLKSVSCYDKDYAALDGVYDEVPVGHQKFYGLLLLVLGHAAHVDHVSFTGDELGSVPYVGLYNSDVLIAPFKIFKVV